MCVSTHIISILLLFISFEWISCKFIEPLEIPILPGIAYHFSIEYCQLSVPGYITSMSALCYCQYEPSTKQSNCSIPGPTFIFYVGTNVSITFHNNLKGDSISNKSYFNLYKDLDITNIHVHGLHISPLEDDIFIKILPNQSHTYNYTIPHDHYPGTHWLHAHHHGSVSFQTHAGLFSALLVKYRDKKQLIDDSLIRMKENVLVFHHIYAVTTKLCNCDKNWKMLLYDPFKCSKHGHDMKEMHDHEMHGMHCFEVFSFCYEYCSMPSPQRKLSGFQYSVNSDLKKKQFQLFLVNGNVESIITDLTINKYRRLRFINTISQYYIQYRFPTRNCEWNLIGIDGIYLTNNNVRNLNNTPYHGEYLLPPGGRIDVIVKCMKTGIYNIESSENNDIDNNLSQLIRVPAKRKLFSIKVNENGTDIIDKLPIEYPPKPYYLRDLRKEGNIKQCGCNTYFDDIDDDESKHIITWNRKECGFVFGMDENHGHYMNLLTFDPNKPISYLEYNSIYEFIMIPENHPYHQHVNPFQVQENIGNEGFIAFDGDWYDTLGSYKNSRFNIKLKTADFTGIQAIHCHILPHEDKGMMTFVNILHEDKYCNNDDGKIYDKMVFESQIESQTETKITTWKIAKIIIFCLPFLLITISFVTYNIIKSWEKTEIYDEHTLII